MQVHKLISTLFLCGLLAGCKKETTVQKDNTLQNIAMSGGGTASFIRVFGGDRTDEIHSVKQLPDGGYLFAGVTRDYTVQYQFLLRTDDKGETVWTKTFPETNVHFGPQIELTDDGGCIVTMSHSYSNSGMGMSAKLIKVDSEGNKLWEKYYYFDSYPRIAGVRETNDGGLIAAGTGMHYQIATLLKTDEAGTETWSDTIGNFMTYDIAVASNADYLVCGSIYFESGSQRIVRTDPSGEILWDKVFEETIAGQLSALAETPEGNIAVCGYNGKGLLRLLDPNGNELWSKILGDGSPSSIDLTSDGGFIVADSKGKLTKLDASGNIVWSRSYLTIRSSGFFKTIATADNGFMTVGSFSNRKNDGFIVKTDSEGN